MVNTAVNGLIVLGIILMIAVVVGGWIITIVARGVGTLLGVYPTRRPLPPRSVTVMPPFPPQPPAANVPAGYVQCRVPGCRHLNPASAQFCRHCGHAFPLPRSNAPRQSVTF
jgi:hypothetical protein